MIIKHIYQIQNIKLTVIEVTFHVGILIASTANISKTYHFTGQLGTSLAVNYRNAFINDSPVETCKTILFKETARTLAISVEKP